MVVQKKGKKKPNVKIENLYFFNKNSFSQKIVVMIVSMVVHMKKI